MTYSVQEYIQQQSTEFLIMFVGQCIRGHYGSDYDYLIPFILRVLVHRDDFPLSAMKELNMYHNGQI